MATGSTIRVCKPGDKGRQHHLGPSFTTSYRQSHAWIAPAGQNIDARTPLKTKKRARSALANVIESLNVDHYVSDYKRHFPQRACPKNPDQMTKAPLLKTINYVTTFEHKVFQDTPQPIGTGESVTKQAYTPKPLPQLERTVFPPNPYYFCEMKALGRDEQPPLVPEERGIWKNLDIYLTTTRADYIPFSLAQQRGIACKDIVTYYDSVGVPRGGKGYGPKKDTKIEPVVVTKIPEYSRKWKKIKNPMKTIPHRGFRSEFTDGYKSQNTSEMQPYSDLIAVSSFHQPCYNSPWQNLCAPSMYCTDYCHIGSGYPINAVIETTKPKKEFVHISGCGRCKN